MVIIKEPEDFFSLTNMICYGQDCEECIIQELRKRYGIDSCAKIRDLAKTDPLLAEDFEATYLLNVDKNNIRRRENRAPLNPKTRKEFLERKKQIRRNTE